MAQHAHAPTLVAPQLPQAHYQRIFVRPMDQTEQQHKQHAPVRVVQRAQSVARGLAGGTQAEDKALQLDEPSGLGGAIYLWRGLMDKACWLPGAATKSLMVVISSGVTS